MYTLFFTGGVLLAQRYNYVHSISTCYSYRQTGYRPHFTLKSQLLLVHFYFVLPQFHIRIDNFYWLFPTYVQFCTEISVLSFFKPFSQPIFLARHEKSAHMLSSSLSIVLQVTKNWFASTINNSFNICQTKSLFSNNNPTVVDQCSCELTYTSLLLVDSYSL